MQVFHLKCEKCVDPKVVKEGLELLGYESTIYPGELGGLDVLLSGQKKDYEFFPLAIREIIGIIGTGVESVLSASTRYEMKMSAMHIKPYNKPYDI